MALCFEKPKRQYILLKMPVHVFNEIFWLIAAYTMPPNNTLPIHGNEKTMNLNTMILTNIQASPYFKVQLYELKTYHQVIDEIYTRVNLLVFYSTIKEMLLLK